MATSSSCWAAVAKLECSVVHSTRRVTENKGWFATELATDAMGTGNATVQPIQQLGNATCYFLVAFQVEVIILQGIEHRSEQVSLRLLGEIGTYEQVIEELKNLLELVSAEGRIAFVEVGSESCESGLALGKFGSTFFCRVHD